MNNYAIVIPTILPERQKEIGLLLTQLAQICPAVPITVSPHIAGQSTRTDCVRALQRGGAFNCRWTLYLEDDAFLAPVFQEEVIRTLFEADRLGFIMATFYSDAQRSVEAFAQGKDTCVIEPRYFWASVCVAVRTEAIPEICHFAHSWYQENPKHWHASDLLLASYCSSCESKILICVPSPVQHRDSPTTLNHHVKTKRYSRTFKKAYGSIQDYACL